MAKKKNSAAGFEATRPHVSTFAYPPTEDGRTRGVDGSVWLWRSVPLGPTRDTKDRNERLVPGQRLDEAFYGLADMVSRKAINRRVAKGQYREFHLLSLSVPTLFEVPLGIPQRARLQRQFNDALVPKRLSLLGVRLNPDAGVDMSGGLSGFWDQVVETLTTTEPGAPMSEFNKDARRVGEVLARAGLTKPSENDLRFADAWWNHTLRRGTGVASLPYVVHVDHMHTMRTPEVRRAVQREIDAGHSECVAWPDELLQHPDLGGMTFAACEGFEIADGADPATWETLWGLQLMDRSALAISVRGLVEPARLTGKELKRLADRHGQDEQEHQNVGKSVGARAARHRGELEELAVQYEAGHESPTIVDTRITVAFDGQVDDLQPVTPRTMRLDPLTNRQAEAWAEMMLCSPVRGNPLKLDVSSELVAHSGLSSLQKVGDEPVVRDRVTGEPRPVGALLGFTEQDSVPVWVTGSPQARGDNLPLFAVVAGTGSGKLLPLDTPVATSDGWAPIGSLAVGDEVLDRDGQLCRVTWKSPVDPSPELCTMSLSDRQAIEACVDHQWIVVPPAEFARSRTVLVQLAAALDRLAEGWASDASLPLDLLWSKLCAQVPGAEKVWPSVDVLRAGLGVIAAAGLDGAELMDRLAERLQSLANEQLALEPGETVMTTGEMQALGGSGFRIRAAQGTADARQRYTELVDSSGLVDGPSVTLAAESRVEAREWLQVARRAGYVARITDRMVSVDLLETHLVVERVEPAPSRPGVCIQVDSPDRSYVCAGMVPTHNTQTLLWLAHQWHEQGAPQVIINPKQNSDQSPFVRNVRGKVQNFDELEESDGVLDPLRWARQVGGDESEQQRLNVGVQLAGDMIARVSPWGKGFGHQYRTDITNGIREGVKAGNYSTGGALRWAVRNGIVDESVAEPVFRFASYPLFKACFGEGNLDEDLGLSTGMTLFQAGRSQFEMPASTGGSSAEENDSEMVRMSANIMRMLTRACTANLSHRDGKIHYDEAWMLEKLAPGEGEQLGRLAREMGVLVMLYTQTASGLIETGLDNYIGRGLLGFTQSSKEADAGIQLFKLGQNQDIRGRLEMPNFDMSNESGVNWGSLQVLRDPATSQVLRGAVFYYIDEYKRVAPVEVRLPAEFLQLTSTNPSEILARNLRLQEQRRG